MEDILLAGLVLIFFIVFLFKAQSFASTLSPSGDNCFKNSRGTVQFIDSPTGNNSTLCQTQASSYPNAKPADNGKHYCCQ